MKKTFFTAIALSGALFIASCGSKQENTDEISVEKIDTLSYIAGMEVAYSIENQVIPSYKADFDVLFETLKQAMDPNATITVEGETFNKDNMQEVAIKYFTPELQARLIAAMNDSTGKTEIYTNEKEKKVISALIGADMGYSSANAKMFEIDKNSFLAAISEVHKGEDRITEEQATKFIENYFTVVLPEQNKKESEMWLAEIEKQPGVAKTASGILYKIENAGDSNVKATNDEDVVKVLYTGKTKDDNVFDSNRWSDLPEQRKEMIKFYQPDQAEKDNPAEFPLNRVIKGWTEGMKLVGKGGKITLWIPSELAYGEQGAGQDIGPNQALRFDVELLDVIPAK